MWTYFSHFIIKYRLILLIALALSTLVMGYFSLQVKMTYDFFQVVPEDDPDRLYFNKFKEEFGDDANLLAIGFNDADIYTYKHFKHFRQLTDSIGKIYGVTQVVALPNLWILEADRINSTFTWKPLFDNFPQSPKVLDSLIGVARSYTFYNQQVVNDTTHAQLMVVGLDAHIANSPDRERLMREVQQAGGVFEQKTGVKLRYAGLPLIRTVMSTQVKKELKLFLLLSVIITGIILFLIFRSARNVIAPMLVIFVTVIFTTGSIALFGYEMTLLTGLLPPIIVVIGIPNCVYMINKFHIEFNRHGNKIRALSHIVRKVGLVTLLTNLTTAVGFFVLVFTDIQILKQFGLIASLNIFVAFFVSIIIIPSVFSYLPSPKGKHLKHLEFKGIGSIIRLFDKLVHKKSNLVIGGTVLITLIAIGGGALLKSVSYMADDLAETSDVATDLVFFEQNFSGVMPFEIVVESPKHKGLYKPENLQKADEIESFLASQPSIHQPVSALGFIKTARQAFYGGNPDLYGLPQRQDRKYIYRYIRNFSESKADTLSNDLLRSFVDSAGKKMRISGKIADVGSDSLNKLVNNIIKPGIDSILKDTDLTATLTGTTLLFLKGNSYLIKNLQASLLLATLIIAVIMAFLFGNLRMVLLSLLPNIVPLIITAGLMGFFSIPLKPSTVLIFSIAFGISVDDSIHFLASYRQETRINGKSKSRAISLCLNETGSSMLYTSLILFAGFIIFSFSEFGGTYYLGILTSFTLLVAMFTNLILLPSLLLKFDRKIN